jgi:hypothetical protein
MESTENKTDHKPKEEHKTHTEHSHNLHEHHDHKEHEHHSTESTHHEHHEHNIKKFNLNITIIIASLLVLSLIINIGLLVNVYTNFNKQSSNTTNTNLPKISYVYIKDSTCTQCTDLSPLITELNSSGIIFKSSKIIELKDAKSYINKYNITKVPVMIFSKGFGEYSIIKQTDWTSLGTIESDGSYIFRLTPPPFKDVATNEIKGLVDVTYLGDKSCTICYNVTLHKTTLLRLGIYLKSENLLDISSTEGQSLIKKYNITLVPTIILSSNAKEYSSLDQAWAQVGTVESDGTFIFRNLPLLNVPYKDLSSNKIISNTNTTQ